MCAPLESATLGRAAILVLNAAPIAPRMSKPVRADEFYAGKAVAMTEWWLSEVSFPALYWAGCACSRTVARTRLRRSCCRRLRAPRVRRLLPGRGRIQAARRARRRGRGGARAAGVDARTARVAGASGVVQIPRQVLAATRVPRRTWTFGCTNHTFTECPQWPRTRQSRLARVWMTTSRQERATNKTLIVESL